FCAWSPLPPRGAVRARDRAAQSSPAFRLPVAPANIQFASARRPIAPPGQNADGNLANPRLRYQEGPIPVSGDCPTNSFRYYLPAEDSVLSGAFVQAPIPDARVAHCRGSPPGD